MRRTIYLASPYGVLRAAADAASSADRCGTGGAGAGSVGAVRAQQPGGHVAPRVGVRDRTGRLQDVREADAIFAVVNGVPPDEGVMVELGMAVALGKPTFLFRDDFRRATDSEEYPLNLMLFTGMPREGWERYYYTSIEEAGSPEKALARWAKGQ